MNYIHFAFAVLYFYAPNANSKCLNASSKSDINMKQIRGVWHLQEVLKDSPVFAETLNNHGFSQVDQITCPQVAFTGNSETPFVTLAFQIKDAPKQDLKAIYIEGYKVSPGTYNYYHYGPGRNYSVIKLVGTDYDNWLVAHDCSPKNQDEVIILSREAKPFTPEDDDKINETLKSFGVERSSMMKCPIDTCPFYGK